jgi:hypothetical protein
MIHAAILRRTISSQLLLANSPALEQARHELQRRKHGRQLLKTNP